MNDIYYNFNSVCDLAIIIPILLVCVHVCMYIHNPKTLYHVVNGKFYCLKKSMVTVLLLRGIPRKSSDQCYYLRVFSLKYLRNYFNDTVG